MALPPSVSLCGVVSLPLVQREKSSFTTSLKGGSVAWAIEIHKKRGDGHPHSGISVFHTNLLCLIVRLIFENKNPQRIPRPAVVARIVETEE